ncbi:hypothetical protein L7F22_034695 [Adiantum nelumboides]|nr:hypothetical protein [Adiantum nelumboides]
MRRVPWKKKFTRFRGETMKVHVVVILPQRLLCTKSYRKDMYGQAYSVMFTIGASLVKNVKAWQLEVSATYSHAVDYLSRWAEAKPVKQITSKDVAKFVYEDICCKFGMPLELLSDKGPVFRGELVDYLCEKLHVRRRFTTPYYPQCNGMNERFNGELIRMLTKMTQSNVKTWDLELPCALWAYRTAIKIGTGFSPFHLVFGKEALLPIEGGFRL